MSCCNTMLIQQSLAILLGCYLVTAETIPPCPSPISSTNGPTSSVTPGPTPDPTTPGPTPPPRSGTTQGGTGGPGGGGTPRTSSSCEAWNGRCIDIRCKNCIPGQLATDLCEHSSGQWRRCCRDCPRKPTCYLEAGGYFTTFYGKRFNYQKEGMYKLSEDCTDSLWSVTVTLKKFTASEAELESVTVKVGDVTVVTDHTAISVTVTQAASVITYSSSPLTVGDVTLTDINSFLFLEFFGVTVTAIVHGRSVSVSASYQYASKTCGLCGAISDEYTDFTTDQEQLGIKDQINAEHEGCPYYGTPETVAQCKTWLENFSVFCTVDVHLPTYVQRCAFLLCLGGTDKLWNIIRDFSLQCRPPEEVRCTMSGHTFYDTFDKAFIQYQAIGMDGINSDCTVTVAKDCQYNDFSVQVVHGRKGMNSYTEVQRVVINIQTWYTIELFAGTRQIKVNGVDITSLPHNIITYNAITIYYEDGGDIVTVTASRRSLVVNYNFHQLLIITLRSHLYQGVMCGMCGNWNNDTSDEGNPSPPATCMTLANPPGCSMEQMNAAQNTCENLFDVDVDDDCHICSRSHRIQRCMYEYCLHGLEGLCKNAKEFSDECYVKRGDNLPQPDLCSAHPWMDMRP